MPKKIKLLLLAVLPSLMLFLAWPPRWLWFLSLAAFIPWLILEKETEGRKGFFWFLYLGMLLFNLLNTWWVWYASPAGSVVMLLANSALMCLPFLAYRYIKKSFSTGKALFAFICLWLAFEYLHLNWEITWPWLSLGNVFAKYPNVVQWYEYTGMLGGSLWVLTSNVLLFLALERRSKKGWVWPAIAIVVPLVISAVILIRLNLAQAVSKAISYEAVIVQPNVDPYKKFDAGRELANLKEMLALAEPHIGEHTSYVIFPETAVVEYVDEDQMESFESIQVLKDFVKSHPSIHLITGISSYNFYDPGEKRKPTVRQTAYGEEYESYNTAMEMNADGSRSLYHKSKLVPGVEKMPYPKVFGFLEKLSINMGGVTGSLGADAEPKVFEADHKPNLAPLICYESVFPGFVTGFVNKGAHIILVMTNDGWWGNTDGYKQHKYYASLRAIENRMQVLRSANTGISCHIDEKGKILSETNWWEKDVLVANVRSSNARTFFSKHGDYIGRFGSFFGLFLLLGAFVKRKVKH